MTVYFSLPAVEGVAHGVWAPNQKDELTTPVVRLLVALEAGWEVEEPVYLRPSQPPVYDFFLRRTPQAPLRLLTVPSSPAVERLVREADFPVACPARLKGDQPHDYDARLALQR